ncbi:substrate-binding domain-containing protein [Parapedobacter sp. GCM10030251]|uniref:LacI family DNA-binding transcriptional regulator n=1 Tax=Parapedobacter sp. GCM10030251 TaxID=3273419 RepID=UPI00361C7088
MKKNPVGIKDIALHAGVSTGPVDKVLNNRGGVSKKTEERILKAIEELGYTPNILASRLKSAKQYSIAALLPEATPDIPYWKEHERGFADAINELKPYGFQIEVHRFHQNDKQAFVTQTASILENNYDGVFMVPIFAAETLKFVQRLKRAGTPVIFFDTQLPELPNIPFIGQHSFDSGFLAGELLHKSVSPSSTLLIISLTQEQDNHLHFTSRENGFREFFKSKQRSIIKYESTLANEHIETELSGLIAASPFVEGIFVTNGIHRVASVFSPEKKHILIGYDLIEENVKYLTNEVIDFLISQQPYTQAYAGIHLFYDLLILKRTINKKTYLPIDIVMKSNLKYYNHIGHGA